MNLGESAGKKLAGGIIDIHFDQQGARSQVNGVGGAHQFPLKFPAGKLRERKIGARCPAWRRRNIAAAR